MKLTPYFFDLKLRQTFRISREERNAQATLLLKLEDQGKAGWGEATLTRYYGVNREGILLALQRVQAKITSLPFSEPEQLWEDLFPLLQEEPFLHCAIDQAAYDLWGKVKGRPVYQLLGLNPDLGPVSSYTLGIDKIPAMVENLQKHPWPVYKIKLGTPQDIDIIRALRQHSQSPFRVDANAAWTLSQTLTYAPQLKALGVEFIEQPLPPEDWKGMKELFSHSPLPIIADESCRTESDVDSCQGHFHGINIKLTKCGGLTPARRMIARARQLKLDLMIGCMTESSVGISAAGQLLPLVDYADLDGAMLISNDPAKGLVFDVEGKAHYPDLSGTGVSLSMPLAHNP